MRFVILSIKYYYYYYYYYVTSHRVSVSVCRFIDAGKYGVSNISREVLSR